MTLATSRRLKLDTNRLPIFGYLQSKYMTYIVRAFLCLMVLGSSRVDAFDPSGNPATESGRASISPMRFGVNKPPAERPVPVCHFGGHCIKLKNFAVEVMIRPYGRIKAWVRGKKGEAIDTSAITLTVTARASDKASHPVAVRWDPAKAWFTGYVPGKLHIVSGPIKVNVKGFGKNESASLQASITPRAHRGGVVIAAGPQAFEVLPYAQGRIEAYLIDLPASRDPAAIKPKVTLSDPMGKPVNVTLAYSEKHRMYLGSANPGESFGTGPVELEVSNGKQHFWGAVAAAKAIPSADMSGWPVIVGPYFVELSRNKKVLVAMVRDAKDRTVSTKDIHVELDLFNTREEEEADDIYSLVLKWNPERVRFDAVLPDTFVDFAWCKVKVQKLGVDPTKQQETLWRGSIQVRE